MSDIIKLLPDSVANQIAAGEVIQRPSSVIKELVENALDAGATDVKVFITDAGKTCIQVVDNGKGMSETDARLAFERHATSKISSADDLYSLHTMGFRGEALASIAAVAQVELKTRTPDNPIGVCLRIEGCKVTEQEPTACPVGANFSVRNLFFNIPARRKFLKSNQTEMNNILAEFERIVLVHSEVAFTLYSADSVVLSLPVGNFRQRIKAVFGKHTDSHLLPVEVETPLVHISGFTGSPESAKKKGAHQFFFVNGRFMRHPYFAKAVQTAYERLIPEGEQVPFFLKFDIDPSRIDVNIHPAKTEIKFTDEQAIWQILLAAVREALGKFQAIPTLDFDTAGSPAIPTFNPSAEGIHAPEIHLDRSFNPFEEHGSGGYSPTRTAPSRPSERDISAPLGLYADAAGTIKADSPDALTAAGTLYDGLPEEERIVWEADNLTSLQHIGRFIVASTAGGLLLVDQHRAHTRILFDDYRRQLAARKGVSQGLLFPQLVQFSPAESVTFDGITDRLADVGFDISPLGGGSYSVLGIPAGTEGLDAAKLLRSILDDAVQGNSEAVSSIDDIIARTLASQAAMPVGQALGPKETADLLNRLAASSNPHYTPEGKNIQYLLTNEAIRQIFEK